MSFWRFISKTRQQRSAPPPEAEVNAVAEVGGDSQEVVAISADHGARREAAGPPESDADLVQRFESIGDNCEFGLVQRTAGAEPLGLFRFNFTHLDALIAGLDNNFADLAGLGDVEVRWENEWIVSEKNYRFVYHTYNHDQTIDPAQLQTEHGRRMRFLARKFLEDLGASDRIFIRKGESPSQIGAIKSLHAAMRRHGGASLLWVCAADRTHGAGHVEWLEEGLMRGWIAGFAAYDRATDVDAPGWLQLCRRAWALAHLGDANAYPVENKIGADAQNFGGWTGSSAAVAEFSWDVPPPPPGGSIMRHRLVVDAAQGKDIFGCLVRPARSGTLYVASAYVRLPAASTATNVGLIINGRPTVGSGKFNAELRDVWQRIWVSAFTGSADALVFPRLVAFGPAGTALYSAGWCVEEGAIPA